MTSVSHRTLTLSGVDAFDSRVPSTGVLACDSTITEQNIDVETQRDIVSFVDIVSYDWDCMQTEQCWYLLYRSYSLSQSPDPQLCKSKSSVLASIPDRQQQPASRPCRKHWLSIDIEAEIQVTRTSEHRSHVVGKSGRNRAWEGREGTGIQHIRLPGSNSPETQSFWIFQTV